MKWFKKSFAALVILILLSSGQGISSGSRQDGLQFSESLARRAQCSHGGYRRGGDVELCMASISTRR